MNINLKTELKQALAEFFKEQGIALTKEITSPFITKKDISRLFGVSIVSVNNWEKKGYLPNRIVRGRKVFFMKNEVLKELENRKS
jgi:hypothetical protein